MHVEINSREQQKFMTIVAGLQTIFSRSHDNNNRSCVMCTMCKLDGEQAQQRSTTMMTMTTMIHVPSNPKMKRRAEASKVSVRSRRLCVHGKEGNSARALGSGSRCVSAKLVTS
jgi:hypothetical protein